MIIQDVIAFVKRLKRGENVLSVTFVSLTPLPPSTFPIAYCLLPSIFLLRYLTKIAKVRRGTIYYIEIQHDISFPVLPTFDNARADIGADSVRRRWLYGSEISASGE